MQKGSAQMMVRLDVEAGERTGRERKKIAILRFTLSLCTTRERGTICTTTCVTTFATLCTFCGLCTNAQEFFTSPRARLCAQFTDTCRATVSFLTTYLISSSITIIVLSITGDLAFVGLLILATPPLSSVTGLGS